MFALFLQARTAQPGTRITNPGYCPKRADGAPTVDMLGGIYPIDDFKAMLAHGIAPVGKKTNKQKSTNVRNNKTKEQTKQFKKQGHASS